ncbi:gamma-tubulin complex component [Grosmannia clavigera kw1407]|uniref:Spindle pole body component n=1 Tax=Grosmannia clavigera (strain kw1407 / UAMH 11150) TaxID=655863 RepID=F0X8X4_GROCL|nr:gamma-tubulin complex component [Grosmannia clavigera kw1407]EFX05478.1 gamma-tubulin complex component [Grosmannia clavigera kw1407]
MADGGTSELFAIPDFWKSSTWQQELGLADASDETPDGFFHLKIGESDAITLFLGQDEPPDDDRESTFFQIPALLRELQPPVEANEDDSTQQPLAVVKLALEPPSAGNDDDDSDLWLYPDEYLLPSVPGYKSWTSFAHADSRNLVSIPVLASEQGPAFLDALVLSDDNLLGLKVTGGGDSLVVDPRGYCSCLLALALGRASVLFSWDDDRRCFVALHSSPRISGFTGPILRSVERTCLECGTYSRSLRAFVDVSFTSATSATPSRAALARAVDRLLLTIQSELGVRGQRSRSVLQLQALIRPVAAVVRYMRGLVVQLSRCSADDGILLATLFQEAQSMEHSAPLLREVAKQVLQIVSEPWLGFVGRWIGLDPRSKNTMWAGQFESKAFVRHGDRVWIDDTGAEQAEPDYFLDADKMPAFIPDEMAQALFETGRNLRFLWTNHPEHALSDPATFARAGPPPLRWQFDWEPVLEAERVADAYELAVAVAIATHQRRRPTFQLSQARQPPTSFEIGWSLPSLELQFFGKDNDQIASGIEASMATLDGPVAHAADDGLTTILRQRLFDDYDNDNSNAETLVLDEFCPHWSLLPLLSFGPVMAAQARLVSRACMQLLFGAHDVRKHLRLQREFQLLGNGVFCSRLSHALFDPDLAGAEARTGVQLSSGGLGLRLSNRDSWPPASSELRLALLGVLVESYQDGRNRKGGKDKMPGDLSFAVRDLSAEEMDRCMDADSLEALDFLRLSYKPPLALLSVMTPAILVKYDRVFRLLLRVLRMYYVVNQLSRETSVRRATAAATATATVGGSLQSPDDSVATRFRFEARHFVSSVMAYFLDTGVGTPWQAFDHWLDDVQAGLDGLDEGEGEGESNATKHVISPERLRERHEQTVDEVMAALFLRKRQQPLLELLETIFGLILDFAKLSRSRASDQTGLQQQTVRLHADFRKKLAVFLTVCRGLGEKQADSAARRTQQLPQQSGPSLAGLLLMLDYNGAFSGSPGR